MIISTDKRGFLVNSGNKNKIGKKLILVLNEVLFFCKKEFGNNIFSIYIRGSVAAGNFKKNISDLDFVIVLKDKPMFDELKKIKYYSLNMEKKYTYLCYFSKHNFYTDCLVYITSNYPALSNYINTVRNICSNI